MPDGTVRTRPGERDIRGEGFYSAAWLDAPRDALEALEQARAAWQRIALQLELELETGAARIDPNVSYRTRGGARSVGSTTREREEICS